MKRHATAVWKGSGKDGKGDLLSQSGQLDGTSYTFSSRFEDGLGTNPEELLAAAHAGCFCMKLSFVVGNHGFTPELLEAKCTITLSDPKISNSHLELKAKIDGMDEELFKECVEDAKKNCPVSMLYDTDITVNYQLN